MIEQRLNPNLAQDIQHYVGDFYSIDCSLGSNPFGAPPAAIAWAKADQGDALAPYYDSSAIIDLSLQISDYIHYPAESIFIFNGSFNALSVIFYKILNLPEKRMLGVGPQFVSAVSEWKLSGGEYHSVPLNYDDTGPTLPLDTLIQELHEGDYTVLYLDNPNNPLGYAYSVEELEALCAAAQLTDTFVIVDEAYGDYLPTSRSACTLLDRFSNLICVRSFSKGLGMAAIRVGYACVHPSMAPHFRKISTPFSPAFHSAKVATAGLSDREFFADNIRKTRERKQALCEVLDRWQLRTLPTHPDVPILTVHCPGTNAHQMFLSLRIATESGAHFSMTDARFDASYCRLRIPANHYDIEHINYRLKQWRSQVNQ